MDSTNCRYWQEVAREAWTRTKRGLGSGYRLVTSLLLPAVGLVVSCIILLHMTITIPITAVVGVSVAVGLYLLFLVGEFCLHVLRVPPERDAGRLRTIRARDDEIARLQSNPDAVSADRPRFTAELWEPVINGDHLNQNWIYIYFPLVLQNAGSESAVDRWRIEILTPSQQTIILTESGLSDSQIGIGGWIANGGNLLYEHAVIPRKGLRSGWLLCHKPKSELGNLTTGQRPSAKVSFYDMDDNQYEAEYPPGFFVGEQKRE